MVQSLVFGQLRPPKIVLFFGTYHSFGKLRQCFLSGLNQRKRRLPRSFLLEKPCWRKYALFFWIIVLVDEHDPGEDGSTYGCGFSTSLVNDTANAFIRDNIRPPEDMTFITPNLVGMRMTFSSL